MYEEIIISDSVKKQFDLSGRSALITGGAGFLGLQFAEAIIEMGGKSLLIDLNKKQLIKAEEYLNNRNYKKFNTYKLNVTDEKKCKDLYKKIWDENSGVDILINCAALTKSGIEHSDVNFFATFAIPFVKPAISFSVALEEKSSKFTYSPLGITSAWIFFWGFTS